MKKEKPFFIGWRDEMPLESQSFLKKIVIPIFIIIPLLAFILVIAQKPFNNHTFELGNIREFTGLLLENPVPILKVTPDQVPKGFSNYILLVGYGKFGADGIIKDLEYEHGILDGRKITISGSLIYGDGQSVLELTRKEKSLITLHAEPITVPHEELEIIEFNRVGEILDPKCYFGVMKPGEGKIHKSCAIRCISGGIPPVFRIKTNGQYSYHILLGPRGQKINAEILDKIGEKVSIKGKTFYQNGWKVLHANPSDIVFQNESISKH